MRVRLVGVGGGGGYRGEVRDVDGGGGDGGEDLVFSTETKDHRSVSTEGVM